ncbi:MAG: hypothetical protein WEG40_13345 [Candidatus Rokuibacteriota bacterium]
MAKKKARTTLRVFTGQIAECQRLYEEQGDPLRAWQAYVIARALGIEIPGWVTAYLDRVAKQLAELSNSEPKAIAGALAGALEIQRPGAGTVFSRRMAAARDDELARDVVRHRAGGLSYTDAIHKLAEHHRVGAKTVERAYAAAKKRGRLRRPSDAIALRRDHFPDGVPAGSIVELESGTYRVERTVDEDEHIIVVKVARVSEPKAT